MSWYQGQKVSGSYFGVPFTGVVEHARPHTLAHHLDVVHVILDTPITVYGLERAAIAMHVTREGIAPEPVSNLKEAA
jgi:hypothetical protein